MKIVLYKKNPLLLNFIQMHFAFNLILTTQKLRTTSNEPGIIDDFLTYFG
jgi:hypothetical protein